MKERYLPTIQQTIDGLRQYQDWRRGEDCGQPPPEKIGAWIDLAIEILETFKEHADIKKEYD